MLKTRRNVSFSVHMDVCTHLGRKITLRNWVVSRKLLWFWIWSCGEALEKGLESEFESLSSPSPENRRVAQSNWIIGFLPHFEPVFKEQSYFNPRSFVFSNNINTIRRTQTCVRPHFVSKKLRFEKCFQIFPPYIVWKPPTIIYTEHYCCKS